MRRFPMSSLIIMVAVLLMFVFSVVILLAARRSGRLPRRAGDVALAAGKGWMPAGGARSAKMPFILPIRLGLTPASAPP